MKILLVVPTYHYNHHYPSFMPSVLFPSGFAYVASALREAGHEVYGLNLNNITGYSSAYGMLLGRLTFALGAVKPDIVGLGGLCTDYLFIKDCISIIRSHSDAKIILGGNIVTNDAEYIFNLLKPDYCIVGEAEEAIVNMLDNISKADSHMSDIPNIGYWYGSTAKFTRKDYDYRDIDSLPFPNYDVFDIQRMHDYMLTARFAYRFINPYPKPYTIITARSCPFSCTFCIHGHGRPRYRTRSIENVIQEIDYSYNKYGFNILVIMDELFAVNKKRMLEFCDALRARNYNFNWSFFAHASANLDDETLRLAKSTGCFFFSYGLESASPTVLGSMNKQTKPSQTAEAIRLAHRVGLGFGTNLIFGDPAETEDTVMESLEFMNKYCKDIDIAVNAIRPYPGSKLFDDCIDRGIIRDKYQYYEHIDEQPWNFAYNMTSMPDKKWLPLLDSIVTFGQLLPWMKVAIPHGYIREGKSATGKDIYQIWYECPHCKSIVWCRELLSMDNRQVTNGKVSVGDFKLVKDAFVKAIRLVNLYYFGSNRIYRLLKESMKGRNSNLLWRSFFSTAFISTGCPHCGKAVKIVIPKPVTLKTFSLGEIKRRMQLSEV